MLLSSPLVLAASLLSLSTQARNLRTSLNRVPQEHSVSEAIPFQAPSPIIVSDHVLELTKSGASDSKRRRRNVARDEDDEDYDYIPYGDRTVLYTIFEGKIFMTNITLGNQTFQVIVDTGSSDTWAIETGFACVDYENKTSIPEADCGFGSTYTRTNTFSEIPNENFNITYGDGEFLTGIYGNETVTLAGITVRQAVALANYAGWDGDGISSGLLGLAYPSLTSAFNGTDPSADSSSNYILYDPIFTTMVKEGLVAPLFSLAIERSNETEGPAGYLALGGIPPNVDFIQEFTETPILITNITGYLQEDGFYTITVDNLTLNDDLISNSSTSPKYIVDSGTTLNYIPTALADAVNAAFDPPANYSQDYGVYLVNCSATPPSFGVVINGDTFYTNPKDMILSLSSDPADGCFSGINDGGALADGVLFILGDTFLKNVLAVFDIGAGIMKFAPRVSYD